MWALLSNPHIREGDMINRLVVLLVLLTFVVAVVAGCGGEEPAPPATPEEGVQPAPGEPEPKPAAPSTAAIRVKIGVVIPRTGPIATYGDEAANGIKLAWDEVQAKGNIKAEVLFADNEAKQQATVTAVNKFIDSDKVHVIIGAITSNNSLAAGDRAEAAGVPMVSPASTNVDITRNKKYVFRVCFTDEFQGSEAANFAFDTLNARRAAVLVSSSESYSMGLGDVIVRQFKQKGGQIVSQMSFTSEADDFGGQVTQLKLKSPDVIFLPAYYESVAKCVSQARAAGLRATFVGTDGWDSPKLFTLSGGAVKGNYFTTHFSPDEERPAVKRFVQHYRAYYGENPGAIAALSYDAAALVFDAVARAGKADRQAITDALAATTDFEAVSGKFSLDENHNAVKPLVILETSEKAATLKAVINP
jgi:branched-chain amino acid transport system substrate-binding protein